ncbi:hypothetical protein [Amycolatopsis sp. SID8362]|uniref:hypothetical protein n=1 Tax=Amycolatopsis sp. SID8362 TaxID=2690346 RepID=UPI00136C4674|nr:hypothetical protein [Amycolatopsis sp. SID8362]NBH04734.1 hypothetical protein [Amycolatopsis sp. SID8362]NED41434.1 hypothetical protein [Amycolatopsis sp. SID8362]
MPHNVLYVGLAAAAVPAVSALTWLIGLAMTLRGSEPRERPALLRAYTGAERRRWRR